MNASQELGATALAQDPVTGGRPRPRPAPGDYAPSLVGRYARTSGDEADGQNVQEQARALEKAKPDALDTFVDDGVSGGVPAMQRPGFRAMVEALEAVGGGEIVARDLKRIGREHPADMANLLHDLARRSITVRFTHDFPLGDVDKDTQTPIEAGMQFFRAYANWAERVTGRETTRAVMQAFKDGARKTESGKPVGRPQKVTDDEARKFHEVARQHGPAEAARRLSVAKGWREGMDPRTAKKYRVGHSTLIGAFHRLKLPWPCVGNPIVSETVSDKEGGSCIVNGAVSDAGVED